MMIAWDVFKICKKFLRKLEEFSNKIENNYKIMIYFNNYLYLLFNYHCSVFGASSVTTVTNVGA